MRISRAVLAAALLLAACGGGQRGVPVDLTQAALAPPGTPPPIDEQLAQLRTRLFSYINAERRHAEPSARVLFPDPFLEEAAQAHAEEMARRGAFDTGGIETNRAIQILAADAAFYGYVGENAALLYYNPETGIDPDAYARDFVAQWMDSPAHKENFTYPRFDRAGIGIAAVEGAIYAAGLLATDLGMGARRPPPSLRRLDVPQ